MKQLRTLFMCGKRASSTTCVFSSLMFRYWRTKLPAQRLLAPQAERAEDGRTWSTECSVPTMARSFFNSTVICLPTRVLKKLANSMVRAQGAACWDERVLWGCTGFFSGRAYACVVPRARRR